MDKLLTFLGQFFTFEPKFGWPAVIALGALVVSILSWLESRAARRDAAQARIDAKPSVRVETAFKAYDSRQVKSDGTGRLIYYGRYDLTNAGEGAVSLRGIWGKPPLPIVVPMRGAALVDKRMPVTVYAGKELNWDKITDDARYLAQLSPSTWEQLGSLNVAIEGGHTESVAIAIVVDNHDTPVDGYMLSLRLVFTNGHEHSLGEAIVLAPKK